jgi:uncharacterized membrane protein YphA (DoxX/SURF4 family)
MGAHNASDRSQQEPQDPRWGFATRVAFRFSFVYFGLYCLATQVFTGLFPIPNVEMPELDTLWPLRHMVFWTASHLFHLSTPLVYTGSGSGDKTFDWVFAFCLLVLAAVATAIWSIADRRRGNYTELHKWFRLAIRFCLAGQMFTYGMYKIIPLQMSLPFFKLVEPFGDFSPMGLLWAFIGASPAYECFAGCAEILGGLLLLLPRTTLLGALVCLADLTQVFVLNMCYDVPVKLLSFHLILLAAFLLAPELPRLARLFVLGRAPGPSTEPPLFARRRANRVALALQVVFGVLLVAGNAFSVRSVWYSFGGGSPKSPFYGIWDVNEFSVDGQPRAPLLTDPDRWRRAIFVYPTRVSLQHMDDSFARFGSSINSTEKTLALTKDGDKNWKANLRFQRPSQDQLTLDGDMDGHKIRVALRHVDPAKFLLVSRGFHSVQEYPFSR